MKILYSALVDTMRGKLQGSVGSAWKGINYMRRHNPSPRQPRSEVQQDVRGIMSSLAGEWYGLTATQKELWNKYASLLRVSSQGPEGISPLTGLNAYVRLNLPLWKYIGTAAKITAPPPSPSVPGSLVGTSFASVDSTNNQMSWTSPTTTCDLVILDYSPLAGLDDRANPRWSFAVSGSASLTLLTHTHAYPTGVIVYYRGRVMDPYGRMTPSSPIGSVTTPA